MAFGISATSVQESVGAITFDVWRTHSGYIESVQVSTVQNWNSSGIYNSGDYAHFTDFYITFGATETYKRYTFSVFNDTVVEADETFGLLLETTGGGYLASTSFTILNDDVVVTPPKISIASTTASEGNNLVFNVSLDRVADRDITIGYHTAPGTASQSGGDYYHTASGYGTVVIRAGTSSGTIAVQTYKNGDIDASETMSLVLDSTSYGTFNSTVATGMIYNADPAPVVPPNISVGNSSVEEGGRLAFVVTLDRPASQTVTLHYATYVGTASQAAGDYTGTTDSTITVAAGATSATIYVQTTEDAIVEPNETMQVRLLSTSYGTIVDGTGDGTIINDDVATTPVSDTVREGTDTTALLAVGGSVSGRIDAEPISGDGVTLDGMGGYVDKDWYKVTLIAGHAYRFAATAGVSTSDTLDAVAISLRNASGATVGSIADGASPVLNFTPTASGTYYLAISAGGTGSWQTKTGAFQLSLTDNGVATVPTVSISGAPVVNEGGTLTFTVTRSGGSTAQPLTVYYSAGGQATSGSDYYAPSGSVTIAAGSQSAPINIVTRADGVNETIDNETLTLTLTSASSGVNWGTRTATGTIRDMNGTSPTDTAAPTLVSTYPADGATAVAPGADITLTFSEAVKAGTGYIDLYRADGRHAHHISVGSSLVTFSADGRTVTINPSTNLEAGVGYSVRMASGVIEDRAGNDFAGLPAGRLDFNTGASGNTNTWIRPVALDVLPVGDVPVTQGYGGDFSHNNMHAIDFSVGSGTPLLAVAPGRVVAIRYDGDPSDSNAYAFGTYITVKHDGGFYATYAHLSRVDTTKGADVVAGQPIGLTGATGTGTGPHLHVTFGRFLTQDGTDYARASYGSNPSQPAAFFKSHFLSATENGGIVNVNNPAEIMATDIFGTNSVASRAVDNDELVGDHLNNRIFAGKGDDRLNGSGGNDTLVGGSGNDTFIFNTALNASTNVDRIINFSVIDDTIKLENAIFTAFSAAGANTTLAAAAFWKNTTGLAHDGDDRIIYNTTTGDLYYDSNGWLAGGATKFATIANKAALTNADFVII